MNNNSLAKQTTKNFTPMYDIGTNVGTEGKKQSLFERLASLTVLS